MLKFWQAYLLGLKTLLTDRAVVGVTLGAWVLYSFFYPLGYKEQVMSNQPILVVDQDTSSSSRRLIQHLASQQTLKLLGVVSQETQAQEALRRLQISGYLVIPQGLEKDLASAVPAQVALVANAAWLGKASGVLKAMGAATNLLAQETSVKQASFAGQRASPALNLVARPLYNTREGYASSLVTGVAFLILHQTLIIGLGVVYGTQRQQKSYLAISPCNFFGQAAAAISLGMLGLIYYAGFMFWFQDYPQNTSLTPLLLAGFVYITACVSLAMFLGSFFTQRERAFQLLLATSLPLFFLANLTWPATSTPLVLTWLAKLLPATLGINLFIKLTQFGASLSEAKTELFTLLGLSWLFLSLAYWRLTKGLPHIKLRRP